MGSLLHVLDFPSTLVGGHGIQKNHSESKHIETSKKVKLALMATDSSLSACWNAYILSKFNFLQNSVVKLKKDADLSGPGFFSS